MTSPPESEFDALNQVAILIIVITIIVIIILKSYIAHVSTKQGTQGAKYIQTFRKMFLQ